MYMQRQFKAIKGKILDGWMDGENGEGGDERREEVSTAQVSRAWLCILRQDLPSDDLLYPMRVQRIRGYFGHTLQS